MILQITIITTILLILGIISHAIYVIFRYLFDISFKLYDIDIDDYLYKTYRYRRFLIHIADKCFRKNGGFWMKFVGRSLIEKLSKGITFIFENPYPEIQFNSNLNNIA